jgi:hypothetical protein
MREPVRDQLARAGLTKGGETVRSDERRDRVGPARESSSGRRDDPRRQQSGGGGGRPPAASSSGSASGLPNGAVFESFYGPNGKLRDEIFFAAARDVAQVFRASDYKATAFRRLYQGFLGFAGPLRDGRMTFDTARERFGVLYCEGVVRQEQRGYLKPVVRKFVDSHRLLILSRKEEMLGFFRYLTNVLCYFGDKD